jgi:hypothetical protein
MSDRYDEGYARAEAVYRQRFNFRYELLHDTKREWESEEMSRVRTGLRKLWPELAEQLDKIAEQADQMRGEYR